MPLGKSHDSNNFEYPSKALLKKQKKKKKTLLKEKLDKNEI